MANLNEHQFSLFDETPHKAAPAHSKGSLDGGRTHEEHLPFDSGHDHAEAHEKAKADYHAGVAADNKRRAAGGSAGSSPETKDAHSRMLKARKKL